MLNLLRAHRKFSIIHPVSKLLHLYELPMLSIGLLDIGTGSATHLFGQLLQLCVGGCLGLRHALLAHNRPGQGGALPAQPPPGSAGNRPWCARSRVGPRRRPPWKLLLACRQQPSLQKNHPVLLAVFPWLNGRADITQVMGRQDRPWADIQCIHFLRSSWGSTDLDVSGLGALPSVNGVVLVHRGCMAVIVRLEPLHELHVVQWPGFHQLVHLHRLHPQLSSDPWLGIHDSHQVSWCQAFKESSSGHLLCVLCTENAAGSKDGWSDLVNPQLVEPGLENFVVVDGSVLVPGIEVDLQTGRCSCCRDEEGRTDMALLEE